MAANPHATLRLEEVAHESARFCFCRRRVPEKHSATRAVHTARVGLVPTDNPHLSSHRGCDYGAAHQFTIKMQTTE